MGVSGSTGERKTICGFYAVSSFAQSFTEAHHQTAACPFYKNFRVQFCSLRGPEGLTIDSPRSYI